MTARSFVSCLPSLVFGHRLAVAATFYATCIESTLPYDCPTAFHEFTSSGRCQMDIAMDDCTVRDSGNGRCLQMDDR